MCILFHFFQFNSSRLWDSREIGIKEQIVRRPCEFCIIHDALDANFRIMSDSEFSAIRTGEPGLCSDFVGTEIPTHCTGYRHCYSDSNSQTVTLTQ